MAPGEQAPQVGRSLVGPGMVGPPGDQVRGLRGATSLHQRRAPGQDRAFVLWAAGGEEGHADGIGRLFDLLGDWQVQHRQHRMAHEVQKAHQGSIPDHRRWGPGVPTRWGQNAGIIGEQFLTEVQMLLARIVEPVNAATGGGGNGHVRGEAEDLGRDGGPHADGLGYLGVLPERRGTGIAWKRLHHPEGTSVDPRKGEAEQPTEAQQAREPAMQTSGT